MKKIIVMLVVLLTGCVDTSIKRGNVENTVTGLDGEKNINLNQCSQPLGVVALVETESSASTDSVHPLLAVLAQNNLPSPIPMLKLMMAKSFCFKVADRGAASKALQRERVLGAAGELNNQENTAKGQMVVADWIITPDVIFKNSNAGGTTVAAGSLLGSVVPFGALLGNIKVTNMEVQTLLTAVNVKTGLQDAVAQGTAEKKDIGFGLGGFGSSGMAGVGAYGSTDIGKVVTAAFMDAHNKLVVELRRNLAMERDQ